MTEVGGHEKAESEEGKDASKRSGEGPMPGDGLILRR